MDDEGPITRPPNHDRRKRTGVISLLCDIADLCAGDESLRRVLQTTIERVCEFNGWSAATVHLSPVGRSDHTDLVAEHVSAEWAAAHADQAQYGLDHDTGRSIARRVMASGRPLWMPLDPAEAPARGIGDFVVTLPLRASGSVVGVMQFFCMHRPELPDDIRHAIESIAVQLGRVVERKRLGSAAIRASTRERVRIAHALHDTTCQELSGLALTADRLATHLHQSSDPARYDAERLSDGLRQVLQGVRNTVAGLAPPVLQRHGIARAFEELASLIETSHQIRCLATSSTDIEDGDIAAELYALASEAVSNAARHAKADTIEIVLTGDTKLIRLEIRDDGVGLPAESQNPGLGLLAMRYRAATLDGSLAIASMPGQGTTIRCEVPRDVIHQIRPD
ncbi:MAG: GAF domain-containing sensor histidine kinase [Phycisphaerales bacterium JB040]